MIKIITDIDEKLQILLKETLDYDFIDENDITEKENANIFIIDINKTNLLERVKTYAKENIPVIVLVGKDNIREMRKLLHFDYVTDCVLRQEIFDIEEAIEMSLNRKFNLNEFYLNDTYQRGIIKFNEVSYITYCRVSRKTELHLWGDEIFTVKSSFSEVEDKLSKIKIFYKLDRSTIINIELIKILDYKEERIIFKDNSYIYTSKSKLKELEDKRMLSFGRVIL